MGRADGGQGHGAGGRGPIGFRKKNVHDYQRFGVKQYPKTKLLALLAFWGGGPCGAPPDSSPAD